jgi:protein-tyrosine phosphatase
VPGAEVAVSPEMPSYLKQGRHLTLNNNGRYFLAELPPLSVPPNWDTFLLSLLSSGLFPILAHPERNTWFMNHPEALSSAVGRGMMVQITAMSLTGDLGVEARDFSVYLLRHNLVHVIASDAHSADFRRPVLSEAVRLAADLVGPKRAEAMVTSVPASIIEGRDIPVLGPAEYAPHTKGREKKWLRRLFSRGDT